MGLFNKKPKYLAAICPECKGHLELDANLETAFCQYCGAQCIVENVRKKTKKVSKLEIVLDFIERQQALKRQDRAERRRQEKEQEQERKNELKRTWWIYALVFGGIFTVSLLIALL
ncbi:MAG: hypothetical protein IJW60_04870 [Clostridia bacterium]|nr:hypothetical protein [Clostridia bacterium]